MVEIGRRSAERVDPRVQSDFIGFDEGIATYKKLIDISERVDRRSIDNVGVAARADHP
jgi:hypothetical protein